MKLIRLSADEARRQLQTGRIVASLTIPRGFVADLKTAVRSPTLLLETTIGGITPRVRQQVQALVYELNRRLQKAFIEQDIAYVQLLIHGGKGKVLGQNFDIIGLDGTERILKGLPRGPRLDAIRDFVHDARIALALTDGAIRSTAQPIQLSQAPTHGRTWELSAQVQAYALALTITFLGLLLAAGALAAERDENVIGRLVRGLVTPGQLVAAKVLLTAIVSAVLGAAVALVFGIIIEAGNVIGGEPWVRLPLLVARGWRSSEPPSARSAPRSGHSRARRGRRRSSRCSSCCRSSSSASFRGRSPRRRGGCRTPSPSPTPCGSSARRSTTPTRGGPWAARPPGFSASRPSAVSRRV